MPVKTYLELTKEMDTKRVHSDEKFSGLDYETIVCMVCIYTRDGGGLKEVNAGFLKQTGFKHLVVLQYSPTSENIWAVTQASDMSEYFTVMPSRLPLIYDTIIKPWVEGMRTGDPEYG